MAKRIKVAIAGINGRMGRPSAEAILDDAQLELVGAFGRNDADYAGKDIGNIICRRDTGILVSGGFQEMLAVTSPDVLLDFTHAEAAVSFAEHCLLNGIRPVIGSSGIARTEIEKLSKLAKDKKTGGMIIPNFSVGAVLMMEFAVQAAAFFANVEIVEMHGDKKKDAPSGTAMHTLAKIASTGSKYNPKMVDEKELIEGSRGGKGDGGVRVHSLRLPGVLSQQEVIFASPGELLRIRHDSHSTECFMKGILMAVKGVMDLDNLVVGLDFLLTRQQPLTV